MFVLPLFIGNILLINKFKWINSKEIASLDKKMNALETNAYSRLDLMGKVHKELFEITNTKFNFNDPKDVEIFNRHVHPINDYVKEINELEKNLNNKKASETIEYFDKYKELLEKQVSMIKTFQKYFESKGDNFNEEFHELQQQFSANKRSFSGTVVTYRKTFKDLKDKETSSILDDYADTSTEMPTDSVD